MSHNIVSSTMSGRKQCEAYKITLDENEVISENEQNTSFWNLNDDSAVMDITNNGLDPYKDRPVGVTKKTHEKENEDSNKWWVKEKCPSCGKGFRQNSLVKQCHSCDKYTHERKCLKTSAVDNVFHCKSCKSEELPTKETQAKAPSDECH